MSDHLHARPRLPRQDNAGSDADVRAKIRKFYRLWYLKTKPSENTLLSSEIQIVAGDEPSESEDAEGLYREVVFLYPLQL